VNLYSYVYVGLYCNFIKLYLSCHYHSWTFNKQWSVTHATLFDVVHETFNNQFDIDNIVLILISVCIV